MGVSGDRYGRLVVDGPGTRRWSVALELLRDGKRIVVGDTEIALMGDDVLNVAAEWTGRAAPRPSDVRRAFDDADRLLGELASADSDFAALLDGRRVHHELVSDEGMALVVVAAD